jgi:hypothetical protein
MRIGNPSALLAAVYESATGTGPKIFAAQQYFGSYPGVQETCRTTFDACPPMTQIDYRSAVFLDHT